MAINLSQVFPVRPSRHGVNTLPVALTTASLLSTVLKTKQEKARFLNDLWFVNRH